MSHTYTVLAVIGPTASGKSSLALKLAQQFEGEIICMDSMQIYKGMDIGTAKPTNDEQMTVKHHLLDIVMPDEAFSVAQYAQAAEKVMTEIIQRGHLPVLVGGTGLYLRALTEGMQLGGTPANEPLREKYFTMGNTEEGRKELHHMLEQVDSVTAAKLHPNDLRRIVRALEVFETTGVPISAQPEPEEKGSPFRFTKIGLFMDRSLLYSRIDRRVEEMLKAGLVDEVKELLSRGVPDSCQSMQGIGYKEIVPYVRGEATIENAKTLMKQNTRHYAKRQITWFKREKDVHWLEATEPTVYDQAEHITYCALGGM